MAWENFGGFLFVGTEEGNIQVWDVETMTMVNDFMDSQFAHDQVIRISFLFFSFSLYWYYGGKT